MTVPLGAYMLTVALQEKHNNLPGQLQRAFGMLIIAFALIQVPSFSRALLPP